MTILTVPQFDAEPWPTLGPQVCAFIERYLVFGPGDLRGQPAKLDPEKRALIYRMYEVYPQDHPQAGRRRFKRVGLSQRKGTAKTEFAAWIAACELHPDGPVRTVGWSDDGQPIGGGVTDPYIAMVAYTEEQTEDLAYAALRVILEHGPLADDFDIGLERIVRKDGTGKAEALASAPNSRDGARTTFQHFDETHRFTLPRLKAAHKTMLANAPKRKLADAWSLETTTAPSPGESSVAEDTMEYARSVASGRIQDSKLFYFHRQASETADLSTEAGIRAAVVEASGPAAAWSDIDAIVEQWNDPTADRTYLERVWLNRLVRSTERAFDAELWRRLAKPDHVVPDGALITLGFDGSRYHDATALVGTEISTRHQFVVGLWECPPGRKDWEVPESQVDDAVRAAFARYQVWRMYADPPYWETSVAGWAGEFGEERVIRWPTWRPTPMARSIRAWVNAMQAGDLSQDGHEAFQRHVGNAVRRPTHHRDENGEFYWLIQKERSDSPFKIDLAMTAILSWEACRDALAAGAKADEPSKYETEELMVW